MNVMKEIKHANVINADKGGGGPLSQADFKGGDIWPEI